MFVFYKIYHLESRWHNSHVLVYHGPLLSHLLGVAPSTFTMVYLNHFFLITSTSWFGTHVNKEHSIRIYLQQELTKPLGKLSLCFLIANKLSEVMKYGGVRCTNWCPGNFWNVYLSQTQVLLFIEDNSKVVLLLPSLKHQVRPCKSMLGRWAASLFEGPISAHF